MYKGRVCFALQGFCALRLARHVLKGGQLMARSFAIVLVVLAAGELRAHADAPLTIMTLPQALAYARDRQPSIKSALAEYDARRAEARVPRAQWLPQIGATAQLFVGTAADTTASYLTVPEMDIPRIGGSRSTTQATATWSPSASSLAGLGMVRRSYDFGRISAQIAVADANAAMARADAESVRLDVALGVEETFHSVLAAPRR